MIPLAPSPNLIQQVFERLQSSIVDHTLAPGLRIRQQELAERLGVSRQPVSHALHLLHRQGLVVESGRKGFAIAPLDSDRIRQIYEVRAALDGLGARLACERIARNRRAGVELEKALAAGAAIDAETPLAELIDFDAGFHQAIYRLSDNPVIEETAAPQWPHVRRSMAAVLMDGAYRSRAWAEHARISELILSGDAAEAASAAATHALNAGRAIEQRFKEIRKAA